MALGRGLNQVFAAALNEKKRDMFEDNFGKARDSAENYLSHFPPKVQQRILLGALASIYADENAPSDIVAWLSSNEDSQWFTSSSIAHQTIDALKFIGCFDVRRILHVKTAEHV